MQIEKQIIFNTPLGLIFSKYNKWGAAQSGETVLLFGKRRRRRNKDGEKFSDRFNGKLIMSG